MGSEQTTRVKGHHRLTGAFTVTTAQQPRIPCQFFARGSCSKGTSCPFAHLPSVSSASSPTFKSSLESTATPADPHASPTPHRSARTSRKGGGQSHSTEKKARVKKDDARGNQDDKDCTWTRELGGALVVFGDGATVSKFSLPSDFSAVRLSNLPPGSSSESISQLLAKITGLHVQKEDVVRVMRGPGGAICSADVQLEDATFATNLCGKLKALSPPPPPQPGTSSPRDISHTPQLQAKPISIPAVTGSGLSSGNFNFHQVDRNKVHCSWPRPTRTARLTFGSLSVAHRVRDLFQKGVYRLAPGGSRVRAADEIIGGRGGGWNTLATFTVVLTDLPNTATERDILEAVPEYRRPRHLMLGKPSYTEEPDLASTLVKSMLVEFGQFEWWEVASSGPSSPSPPPGRNRVRAQARFAKESQAREAVAALNNKLLPFSETDRLTVQLVTCARFRISARIYDAVREQIDSHKAEWEKRHVRLTASPPGQGYRFLKLESEDTNLVAQAKETLEGIFKGQVVTDKDGGEIWHPHLGRRGNMGKKGLVNQIRAVERECQLVILVDKQKSQLRLCGPEKGCRDATEKLMALLQNTEQAETHRGAKIIELQPDQFQWACRGGFRLLVARLGKSSSGSSSNKATFDIVSTPKRIIVTGSDCDYRLALDLVASKPVSQPNTGDEQYDAADCSVCWTEAEDPIVTSCNHIYCRGCFTDLAQAAGTSASTDAAEFCISCVGGQGFCNTVFALAELQSHLSSSAALEDIFQASLSSYIRRRPDRFRSCPTPDCGQIYRSTSTTSTTTTSTSSTAPNEAVSTETHTFTCPRCLIPSCTKCDAPHPGMTCAEHRDLASGGYEALERAKKQLGIKDCPKCKTAIEKVDGCNHMTCRGCGTHLCWVCLGCFETADKCYDHLSKAHGGVFGAVAMDVGV